MILAIDTSTQWMGISLLDGTNILYEKTWKTNRRHTVELSPAINTAFSDTQTNPKTLTAVAIALGPGSFTSLRIGIAAAKGLAMALHIPVIGVPSLDITASGIPVQDIDLYCLLRAGRGRFALQKYVRKGEKWEGEGELLVMSAEELEKNINARSLVCGEMTPEEKQILSRRWRNVITAEAPQNIRRPSILANIAYKRLKADDTDDIAPIAPIYLRTVKNVDNLTPV